MSLNVLSSTVAKPGPEYIGHLSLNIASASLAGSLRDAPCVPWFATGTQATYTLGLAMGDVLGEVLGDALGVALGETLGLVLGNELGLALGEELGEALGVALGDELGDALGEATDTGTVIST
jgi:hypothetical protein